MKKIFLLGAMMCALGMMTNCKSETILDNNYKIQDCQPLFDSLEYNDNGIAFIKDITIVINSIGRYDFCESDPIYAGKQGATALAFDYCGEHYYIPLHEKIGLKGVTFPDTAKVTFKVWRDYKDNGRPFAIVYKYESIP